MAATAAAMSTALGKKRMISLPCGYLLISRPAYPHGMTGIRTRKYQAAGLSQMLWYPRSTWMTSSATSPTPDCADDPISDNERSHARRSPGRDDVAREQRKRYAACSRQRPSAVIAGKSLTWNITASSVGDRFACSCAAQGGIAKKSPGPQSKRWLSTLVEPLPHTT